MTVLTLSPGQLAWGLAWVSLISGLGRWRTADCLFNAALGQAL
ncbi:uncharacterized protein METZ01_LOCUS91207 [marine metagenome]|uniref:Uncharacterized protein n=1 Tax=marine metagenome TaxID=408172 RepID=A0A381VG25_9ZZZZ